MRQFISNPEMQNNFESVNIKTWCPESDEQLCGENGELMSLFGEGETTNYETRSVKFKDATVGNVDHTKSTADKDEL